ncbi:MAG: hypothetical protein FWG47_02910 [Propionibacteriaceae bacterium]|nr:hypothetical protein [Propionibacteriaceae bacterium]
MSSPEYPQTQPDAQQPYPPAPQGNPGTTMGVVGLILGLLLGPLAFIGLILSFIGLRKSKAVGMKNGVAVAGIIISIVFFLISIPIVLALGTLATTCIDQGSGVHWVAGIPFTCP